MKPAADGFERPEGLDPFEAAQGQRGEAYADEQDSAGGPGEKVRAAAEAGRRPEIGQGRDPGDEEGEQEDKAKVLARDREPGGQRRGGQGHRGHDAPPFVPEREEERLDLVLLPRLAGELVVMAGEELLEALDVLAEVPVIDVELRPQVRLEGVVFADVGGPDLGKEGQAGEVGQPASAAVQSLQSDDVDGRLAPDEDRSAHVLQEPEILAPDLVGEAEDVAVPRFVEAVAVAESHAFVLGVEPGLAEERGEGGGIGGPGPRGEARPPGLQRGQYGGETLPRPRGLLPERGEAVGVVIPGQEARQDQAEGYDDQGGGEGRGRHGDERPPGPDAARGHQSLSARISVIRKDVTGPRDPGSGPGAAGPMKK